MAEAKDVARFFIALAQQENEHGLGDLMTNLRLQELLYLAQGWHLQRYDKPLFDAPIEAWDLGPVVPSIYETYKTNCKDGIVGAAVPDDDAFTPEEFDLLMDVALEYSSYSTSHLVRLGRALDSPWSNTEPSSPISQDIMKQYFSRGHLTSFDEILDGYPTEIID